MRYRYLISCQYTESVKPKNKKKKAVDSECKNVIRDEVDVETLDEAFNRLALDAEYVDKRLVGKRDFKASFCLTSYPEGREYITESFGWYSDGLWESHSPGRTFGKTFRDLLNRIRKHDWEP